MNRVIVRLKIVSSILASDEISERVGIECDKAWKIGDFRAKTAIKEKRNGWVLNAGLSESESMESQLIVLLKRIAPQAECIKDLSRESDVELSCVFYSEEQPEIYFSPAIVAQIANLGAGLDIDYYCR